MNGHHDEIQGWFSGRLPEDWFSEAPEIRLDREEILVIGRLADVELGADATEVARAAAREARAARFREETRAERMRIAEEARGRVGRIVSWGVRIGDAEHLFTTLSVPVMTRLRQPERETLDTLVAAGVARSRSEALAWCVKLVGQHEGEWIGGLREALKEVARRRAAGPVAG